MTINPYRTESRFEWPLLMQWAAPIQRHHEALEMRRVNVCLWLQAVLTAPDKQRLLYPRKQTLPGWIIPNIGGQSCGQTRNKPIHAELARYA